MGYLVESLELSISKVAYTKYDATILVRWSYYTWADWCGLQNKNRNMIRYMVYSVWRSGSQVSGARLFVF
jgi:hypothetical protein